MVAFDGGPTDSPEARDIVGLRKGCTAAVVIDAWGAHNFGIRFLPGRDGGHFDQQSDS